MHFVKDYTYHLYNRSNEVLFYTDDNYLFFLKKVEKYLSPFVHILAWCLLPNHFHFLFVVKTKGADFIKEKHRSETQVLSKNVGIILSSYSQAINKQKNRKGSLFAHRTSAKALNLKDNKYLETCFTYIHQNPCDAGIVNDPVNWEYSSYKDFIGKRKYSIVNIGLAIEMLGIEPNNFKEWSSFIRNENLLEGIF